MGTVYAIANQKGGVGKTTTAINICACVAEAGFETLIVDMDPQCNATVGSASRRRRSAPIYDVLIGDVPIADVAVPTAIEHLWIAPAGPIWRARTWSFPRLPGSESRLAAALTQRDRDTTSSCSTAPLARSAHRQRARRRRSRDRAGPVGVLRAGGSRRPARHALARRRDLHPRLTIAGMVLTMHDARTRLAQDVEREVREHFPDLVFTTVIPRNVRIGEAPSFGKPVTHHDPHCAGADAYFELAKEVTARG